MLIVVEIVVISRKKLKSQRYGSVLFPIIDSVSVWCPTVPLRSALQIYVLEKEELCIFAFTLLYFVVSDTISNILLLK